MTRCFAILFFCLSVLFGTIPKPGSAETMAELMTLQQRFNAGEYEAVLAIATSLAEQGVPRAMVIVGVANLFAMGLPENQPEGIRWLTRAADAGSTRAMQILGEALMYGWYGLEVDQDRALAYFEQMAEMDNPLALTILSRIYSCGTCGMQDDSLAAVFGERAVQVVDAETFLRLARMKYDGTGMQKDMAEARRLFQIAALMGDGAAANQWGHMAHIGQGGQVDLPEAMRAFALGVELGYPRAGANIAKVMFQNPDLYPDRATAMAWCMWSVREAVDDERTEFADYCKSLDNEISAEERSAARNMVDSLDPETVR